MTSVRLISILAVLYSLAAYTSPAAFARRSDSSTDAARRVDEYLTRLVPYGMRRSSSSP